MLTLYKNFKNQYNNISSIIVVSLNISLNEQFTEVSLEI